MAAFERVSTVKIHAHDRSTLIDFRTATLSATRRLKSDSSDDYDPLEHRVPKQPISLWMAYFNIIRTSFGPAVLGFPIAVSQTGLVLGAILAMSIGILVTHTHLMLLRCLNEICRQLKIPHISYRYGFRIAMLRGPPIFHWLGHHGPCIIGTFMLMSQIGICGVFIDLTSDSLRDIMDWNSSITAKLCLLIPYLLLEYYMKNLAIISYVSMLGTIMNLLGCTLIFYLIFLCPHGETELIKTRPVWLLFAIGILLFNSSNIGVILSLDKNLKEPKLLIEKYGVITIGMTVCTVIATAFGTLGYWSFGPMEENVLRYLPYDDGVTITILCMYLVSVVFAYPIQCFPGYQIILEIVQNYNLYEEPSKETMRLVKMVSRPVFVLLTFTVAYLVPFQTPLVSFVGNMCTTMLSLVFPALMEICLIYPGPYGRYKIYLIKNVLIVLGGVILWFLGVGLCAYSYLIYLRILSSAQPSNAEYV